MRFEDDEEQNRIELSTTYESQYAQHNKYGKMLLLYESKNNFITLGPDYWCFFPTFIIFFAIALAMTNFVLNNSHNIYFQIATVLIEIGTCLSYLAVALSNPGIIFQDELALQSEYMDTELKKLCRKCNMRVPKKAYHCRDCDVCIAGYDHHCPWTSKCIGKGNLCRFYIFIAMVPTFLVYTFVAFSTLMSDVMIAGGNKYVRSH